MIKLLNAKLTAPYTVALDFSDQSHGVFDASAYLNQHQGHLLEALREPHYFERFFIEAGALSWPNGLALSAARLHALSTLQLAA